MVFVSQKERIQRKLYDVVSAGVFYAASIDPDTKLLTVDGTTTVPPAEVLAWEGHSTFGEPIRNRRDFRYERRSWQWKVLAAFDQEVTSEGFERDYIEQPAILGRDPANGLEQVTLRLVSTEPRHPYQQQPSVGSRVVFTFEAELSPV